MKIEVDDFVRTESGDEGKVVHVTRMTVFVALPTKSEDDTLVGYLVSQLTKIEEPPAGQRVDP